MIGYVFLCLKFKSKLQKVRSSSWSVLVSCNPIISCALINSLNSGKSNLDRYPHTFRDTSLMLVLWLPELM